MRNFSSWSNLNTQARLIAIAASLALLTAAPVKAAVSASSGYIYDSQLLGSSTQSCIAAGPGGTFVGIGLGFTANAQAVVQVSESGSARLVAFGFNSIADCAYDATNDVLYISDNADSGELPGAASGDTVFRVAAASSASGLSATGLELLPANGVPAAAGLAITADGSVLVGNASGVGTGTVQKITLAPMPAAATFASPLDFVGGVTIAANGDVLVAESIASFQSQIERFNSAGTLLSTLAGPSFAFGSYDLAYSSDGLLLATGSSGIAAFNNVGAQTSFAGGFSFSTGITTNLFTGRVEALDSFSFSSSDRSLHRFTPVSKLLPGGNDADSECTQEFYGVELVAAEMGATARNAICVDGAACDADGKVNDRCVFPVGLCFKVADPRFPECAQNDVTAVSVTAKPSSAAFSTLVDRIQAALPITTSTCFFSDGISVPVKVGDSGKKPGKGAVKTKTSTAAGKDSDTVRLICQPAP